MGVGACDKGDYLCHGSQEVEWQEEDKIKTSVSRLGPEGFQVAFSLFVALQTQQEINPLVRSNPSKPRLFLKPLEPLGNFS